MLRFRLPRGRTPGTRRAHAGRVPPSPSEERSPRQAADATGRRSASAGTWRRDDAVRPAVVLTKSSRLHDKPTAPPLVDVDSQPVSSQGRRVQAMSRVRVP